MSDLVDEWNRLFFDGRLSSVVLGHLKNVPNERSEVRAFVERVMRRMHEAGIEATDFSELQAWQMGVITPRVLPGAWGDIVPPVTMRGRHDRINDYLAGNPWRAVAPGTSILDVGCGFPPFTTVDLAERFPDCRIIGADPSFGRYMVYDRRGDYACFERDGVLRYFQPAELDAARWAELLGDTARTRARFSDLLQRLLPRLPVADGDALIAVEHEGARLVKNPVRQYEQPNLSFMQGGISHIDLRDIDIIRCFNVLIYFDGAFRSAALGWASRVLAPGGIFLAGVNFARALHSKYTVYQKTGATLIAREFAFSPELIRPVEQHGWFALHDDDYETTLYLELLKVLRSDADFRRSFDAQLDSILGDLDFCPRRSDGYLGGMPAGVAASDLEQRVAAIAVRLDGAGFVDGAVTVLKRAGYHSWRNSAGHIAVTPGR